MRPVYMVAGGITKFSKSTPTKDFRYLVKESVDNAMSDVPNLTMDQIDGSICSYFSDHFTRQLMAGIMVQDYLGLTPKMSKRVEGGGATGGLCFQSAWEAIASGRMEVCLGYGFETMSHVNTWKGNEFIALASDVNFDYPVGGFYTGYYAMMVRRHMHEFGTTRDQLSAVSVKNHRNAIHNPYAQFPAEITKEDVEKSEMVADPLRRLDICVMSDGAASVILASEEMAYKLTDKPILITGVGTGTDAMRMSDRPSREVILLPNETPDDYKNLKYPGVHSFRGGRVAAKQAYKMAKIENPLEELDFVELHDAFTSSEIQTYEDLGLCKYGEGGSFVESGAADLGGKTPVNPSGGLLACGHPVGATGLMQAVFAFWQLQGSIGKHFGGDESLQIKDAKRGLIHSHAGTGTYISVSILERGF
jgi:acetyl-CoA C-acetyltransferase